MTGHLTLLLTLSQVYLPVEGLVTCFLSSLSLASLSLASLFLSMSSKGS